MNNTGTPIAIYSCLKSVVIARSLSLSPNCLQKSFQRFWLYVAFLQLRQTREQLTATSCGVIFSKIASKKWWDISVAMWDMVSVGEHCAVMAWNRLGIALSDVNLSDRQRHLNLRPKEVSFKDISNYTQNTNPISCPIKSNICGMYHKHPVDVCNRINEKIIEKIQ